MPFGLLASEKFQEVWVKIIIAAALIIINVIILLKNMSKFFNLYYCLYAKILFSYGNKFIYVII